MRVFGSAGLGRLLVVGAMLVAAAPNVRAAEALERARARLAIQVGTLPAAGAGIIDRTLALEASSDPTLRAQLAFGLAQAMPDNMESAIARIRGISGTLYADSLGEAALRAALRDDLTGLAPGTPGGDPLVLAALVRWLAADPSDPDLPLAVARLVQLQQVDGGFAFADNPSDVALTAEVVRALPFDGWAAAARTRAVGWLRAQLSTVSMLPDADVALLALGIGRADRASADVLVAALLARQAQDGSFDGGDLRATALGALALSGLLPDLVVSPRSVVLAEAVTGQRHTVHVAVGNRGPADAAACGGTFRVSDSTGATVSSGDFQVPPVAAGMDVVIALDLGVQGETGQRVVAVTVNDPPSLDVPSAPTVRVTPALSRASLGQPFRPSTVAGWPG